MKILQKINKMRLNKTYNYWILAVLIPFIAWGQKKRDSIASETVTVTKSYQPTVKDADKVEINPPVISDESFEKRPVEYNPLEIQAVSTYMAEQGKLVRPSVQNQYFQPRDGYVAFSVGNRKSLRLQGHYLHEFSNVWKAGAGVNFFYNGPSSLDSLNFNRLTDLNLHGDIIGEGDKLTYTGQISYNLKNSLYRDTLLPFSKVNSPFHFHRIGWDNKLGIDDFSVREIGLNYNFLAGPSALQEHVLDFNISPEFPISGLSLKVPLHAGWVNGNNQTGSYNNNFVSLTPSVQFERERFLFNVGAALYYQNREDLYENFQFFPEISVQYHMIYELLTVYLNYEGGLKNHAYSNLLNESIYIYPNVPLLPSLITYHFFGGFKGNIGGRVVYDLRLGVANEKNALLMNLNSSPDGLALSPEYDSSMDYYYFSPSLSYVVPEKFETKILFDYYQYNPSTATKAWNKSEYKLSWLLRFHAGKFRFQTQTFYVGPRYYSQGNTVLKANAFTDLNLRLDYVWNKQVRIFVEGNNLLNNNYQLYHAYPVFGFRVMAGAMYSF